MSELKNYGTLITRDVVTLDTEVDSPILGMELGEFADFMINEMAFLGPWETLYRKADLIILYQSQTKTIMTLQRA